MECKGTENSRYFQKPDAEFGIGCLDFVLVHIVLDLVLE